MLEHKLSRYRPEIGIDKGLINLDSKDSHQYKAASKDTQKTDQLFNTPTHSHQLLDDIKSVVLFRSF